MAFEGDLSDLALGDIFQTLAMTRQAGILVVRGKEERSIAFGERGIAVLSMRDSIGRWMARYLAGAGAISDEDLEKALQIHRRRRTGFLGEIILEIEGCTEEAYREAGRYIAQEELFDLFTWRQGTFEFEQGEVTTDAPFKNMWFDVGGIAMEAARRMDETARLSTMVDPSHVLLPADGVPIPDDLTPNTRRVLEALDGTRTTEAVFQEHYLGEFDCLKAVATLIELGLVRSASLDEILDGATASITRKRFEHAARLYELACHLEPERPELRTDAAEALVKAGEKRAASAQFAELGDWNLQRGDNPAAVTAYQKAIRLDSSNPDAHAGLMHALFERGEIEEGVEAARQASKSLIALGEFDRALQIASVGLDHEPGDVPLRMAVANAHLGEGRTQAALEQLDDLASILETTGENDKRLLDVYRQIAHLDESRRDCLRRIDEIQAYAQAKRKRMVQRLAIGVGVVLASLLAIPMLSGSGLDGRIDELEGLIAEQQIPEANELLADLSGETLGPSQQERLDSLRARLVPDSGNGGGAGHALPEVERALEKLYSEANEQTQQKRHVQALRLVVAAFDRLDQEEQRNKGAAATKAVEALRRAARKEAHLVLTEIAASIGDIASQLARWRDQFNADELRKADPATMKELVEIQRKVAAVIAGDDWEDVEQVVQRVVALAGTSADKSHLTIIESTIRVLADAKFVAEKGDKAQAEVRKHELAQQFRISRNETSRLIGEGKVSEAIELYQSFLALCDELEGYEPAELYENMRKTFLENLDLDGRVATNLERLQGVLEAEQEAARALADSNYPEAWRLRAQLELDYLDIAFDRRFRLPVWIESHPAGAEVYELRAGAPARKLGKTPMAVHCTLKGTSRFAVRMDGYHEHVVERRGAKDTRGGSELMDLVKLPRLNHEPEQGGHTSEGSVAIAGETLVVAGRDGIVRAISRTTEAETARLETGLLDGFSGTPAASVGRIFLAGLDGSAFVLDPETLEQLERIELAGPARASVIAVAGGAVIADEGGVVRKLDADGKELWKIQLGKIRVDGALEGNTVFLTTVEGDMVAIDAATGEESYRIHLSRHPLWGPPTIVDGVAYVASDERWIVRVDLAKREVVWRQRLESPIAGRVAVVGERVVAAATTGALYVLSAATGETENRILLGARVLTGALQLEDGFAAATAGGVISRFTAEGDLVWRYDVQEPVRAPLALIGDELLIVTRRGKVIAVEP